MTTEADTGLMRLGLLAGTRSQEEARHGPAQGPGEHGPAALRVDFWSPELYEK